MYLTAFNNLRKLANVNFFGQGTEWAADLGSMTNTAETMRKLDRMRNLKKYLIRGGAIGLGAAGLGAAGYGLRRLLRPKPAPVSLAEKLLAAARRNPYLVGGAGLAGLGLAGYGLYNALNQ